MTSRASTVARDGDALFFKDGGPVKFCFHRSVTQGRDQITQDVKRHGGTIVTDERIAHVLLVDEEEDLAFIRRRYYSSTERYRLSLYVEPRGFVQRCIRSGEYFHVGPIKQGMPGRAPGGGGRVRVAFTEEDRDHLAYYLATRFPTRDGRMGNNAYKDLERLGESGEPEWAWAQRHTFHSWREHYKIHPAIMNARIEFYLEKLKNVGHHFGQDPRRHDYRELRQEEEESDSEEEEQQQQQNVRGQASEGREREQARPRDPRDYLARHERELQRFDHEEDAQEEEEIVVREWQRMKRRRVDSDARRHDGRERLAKRARVLQARAGDRPGSSAEAGDENIPERERDHDDEESPEIEGDDLFGDRAYGQELHFDASEINYPMQFPSSPIPLPESDGAPLSTQATLVASPVTAGKEREKGPVETAVPTYKPTIASSPKQTQQTTVATREGPVAPRASTRGASAQPGPSAVKATWTRDGLGEVEAPYRNTRARSQSVEPQAEAQSQPTRSRKGKAREEVLVSIKEDAQINEGFGLRGKYAQGETVVSIEEDEGPSLKETYAQESIVTGRLSTLNDELAVEGLLQASVVGSEGSLGVHDGVDDESDDEDLDMSDLPPTEFVEVESEPTDSDDAETHGSLVRGAVQGGMVNQEGEDGKVEAENSDSEPDSDDDADRIERMVRGTLHGISVLTPSQRQRPDQNKEVDVGKGSVEEEQLEEDSDDDADDEADRIERMVRGTLRGVPAPAPVVFEPKVTRSRAASVMRSQAQTQTRTQTQTHPKISPRRTRSGRERVPPGGSGFPDPRTRMRVDRIQEEEGGDRYEPPAGSRAARAVRGRGKRG